MGLHLFAKLQRAWASWDVRCFVLLSLFLQSFLLFIAPFRKRSSSKMIYGMIWLTYLVADWTALFAAGLIADSQKAHNASSGNDINEIMVFWSPFLLVHLGGPDTITAFSLEDNELWLRHLLKLIGQLVSTGYVFYRSLPNNELLVPTILMFLAGIIKYSERIRSLHRASVRKITKSMLEDANPGPNYAKLVEEYASRRESRMRVAIKSIYEPQKPFKFLSQKRSDHETEDPSDSREMIRVAYNYYMKFRGLVADLIFSRKASQESREYLVKLKAEKAFKVVEIELNFIYEVLYTKAVIIHDRPGLGYIFRFVYSVLIFATFGLWYFVDKSQHFTLYDVKITYTLLFGAVVLDIISYSMRISSDWMTALAKMKEEKENPTIGERCFRVIGKAVDESKLAAHKYVLKRAPRILSGRWSESIQQFNLIDSCLLGRPLCDRLYELMGIQDVMEDLRSVKKREPFKKELRDFIFDELKFKSEKEKEAIEAIEAKEAKEAIEAKEQQEVDQICMDRGVWVLKHCFDNQDFISQLSDEWVSKVEYDKSVIIWHIATDLCCNYDEIHSREDPAQDKSTPRGYEEVWHRRMSKIMSDYMLHLLIRESQMMADVSSIAQIRFRDTVEEANVFLQSLGMDPNDKGKRLLRRLGLDPKDRRRFICSNLWHVNTDDVQPRVAKGDRSKSVLFDGCRLAKKLCNNREVNKWELICKVWVAMLSYAAVHCRGHVHAAQLGKGGQLLTLVWMLMIHLGLGNQFRIKEGSARMKFVADN